MVKKMSDIAEKQDFPLYNTLSNLDIAVLTLSILLVFAVVSMQSFIPSSLKSVLIFLIPFCAFLYVCRGKLDLIVKRLHKSDLAFIVAYVVLYYIIAIGAGIILYNLGFTLKPNAILSVEKDWVFWILFLFQIFGEELFKLSMFITALSLLYRHASNINNWIISIAALFTSFLFAIVHMFAYGGILQPLMILGLGNLVLIYAYVRSKNVVVPYVSHLIVDLIPLMATMFLFIS